MTTYIIRNINKQLNRYKKHNKKNNSQKTNHYERPFSKLLFDENNISKVGPKNHSHLTFISIKVTFTFMS